MMEEKSINKREIPKFTWIVLIAIGCIDLFRGIMHTIFIDEAIALFAHFDLSDPMAGDLMLLMTVFGISNLISGAMSVIIAFKARDMADIALIIIPSAYLIGVISTKINFIVAQSDLLGQYGMIVYLVVCIGTFIATRVKFWLENKKNSPI
ncbi:MAG: hypothetical protein ACTSWY_12665 [Promethearchaeota archaeon]